MNEFRGILDLQVESVLSALKAQQDLRCREIESATSRRAEQLTSDSRHRMRQRVHMAVVEERRRRETALLDARHRIETAGRRRIQQQYRQFLHEAIPLLTAELGKRWRDEESRRSWCEMVISEAAGSLPGDPWTIEHPCDWPSEDTKWLEQAFEARRLPKPVLQEDDAITAGLRVRLGSACLDATVDGLMTDIRAVEGRLLAAWERGTPERGEDEQSAG
jgi:hypothetical protein